MAQRTEFERPSDVDSIRTGQTIRIRKQNYVLDFTGFVQSISDNSFELLLSSPIHDDETKTFVKTEITEVTEICSSDIFYRLCRLVGGESAGNDNIH